MAEENIRPWGNYEVIEKRRDLWRKIIYINPNSRLSLQYHKNRNEEWKIIDGEGSVQIGDNTYPAKPGDKFYVQQEEKHRISAGGRGMILEEIANAVNNSSVSEDDIVRLEDDYGRVKK